MRCTCPIRTGPFATIFASRPNWGHVTKGRLQNCLTTSTPEHPRNVHRMETPADYARSLHDQDALSDARARNEMATELRDVVTSLEAAMVVLPGRGAHEGARE
jgi:hypothetical protein